MSYYWDSAIRVCFNIDSCGVHGCNRKPVLFVRHIKWFGQDFSGPVCAVHRDVV